MVGMATIITTECINCGACEPECPNTAIYQGGVEYDLDGKKVAALQAEIFYIVPEKCTECVGFYDYEACAAVCPVDCCVTDPGRVESEGVLLERAKVLHPDKDFGAEYPSRFQPGRGTPSGKKATGEETNDAAPAPAAVAAAPVAAAAPAADSLADFEIPVGCRTCDGEFAVAFRFFQPGVVLRCPHCGYNFTPGQRLFRAVSQRLDAFAHQVGERIDACNAAIEAAEIELEEAASGLRESAVADIRSLVLERTEARKAGIFG
jgi:ferredoxin